VTSEERKEVLADEWIIVRNSGEIPEITYHSALHFLEKDTDGPGFLLCEEERTELKEAAVQRYHEIILRDIDIENFHKTLYRGIERTIYNWSRFRAFCERQNLDFDGFRESVATALLLFLEQGRIAAGETLPAQFLNCDLDSLQAFAEELRLEQLPLGLDAFTTPIL